MNLRRWGSLVLTFVIAAGWVPPATTTAESGARWIEVDATDGNKMRVAVVRPRGGGPFPVVVVLHGTTGFTQGYVELAEAFAKAGFLGVVGCWFAGQPRGRAPREVGSLIDCPQGPPFRGANLAAAQDVKALISAARKLPEARADRVGLFGHSRGAVVALLAASTGVNVQAVVASSGAYTQIRPIDALPITAVKDLQPPVLMLHGTLDRTVNVQQARDYERALRELGKPVEAYYYEGFGHLLAFYPETQRDALRRAIEFFTKRLVP